MALNIKAIRTIRGYTQDELAAKVGIQRATITKIENGTNHPTTTNAQAIADVLGFENWWDIYTPNNAKVQWKGEAPI